MRTPSAKRSSGRAQAGAAPEGESAPVSAPVAPVETRRMEDVVGALMRSQTRALVFTHLSHQVISQFGVGDAGPPRLLLRLPGGGPFPADTGHIVDIALELDRMASDERVKLGRLLASYVSAPAEDVDPAAVPVGPRVPARSGEEVVEAAAVPVRRRGASVR